MYGFSTRKVNVSFGIEELAREREKELVRKIYGKLLELEESMVMPFKIAFYLAILEILVILFVFHSSYTIGPGTVVLFFFCSFVNLALLKVSYFSGLRSKIITELRLVLEMNDGSIAILKKLLEIDPELGRNTKIREIVPEINV